VRVFWSLNMSLNMLRAWLDVTSRFDFLYSAMQNSYMEQWNWPVKYYTSNIGYILSNSLTGSTVRVLNTISTKFSQCTLNLIQTPPPNLIKSHAPKIYLNFMIPSPSWRSRDSSAVQRWATGWIMNCYSAGRCWEFFSSPLRPNWLWVPPRLLSNGYRGLFVWG
jgi:hypothetical protein